MIPIHALIICYVFIIGLCIGSFMNVCIYRLPMSKSIVSPPSACMVCGYQIRFYDNIPVLSYLFLKGRCRKCQTPISIRYPIVELLTGLFAVCVTLKFGPSLEALVYFVFIATLIVITYIDIDHQIIPDIISLPGIPIFFAASFALPSVTVTDALLGILLGGGSLFAVAWAYSVIRKMEGMGGGDIKLLAMMGGLIGWQGVLFTIFTASAIGTLVGVGVMMKDQGDMKMALPFGPFLSIGAITYVLLGAELTRWYFDLFNRSSFLSFF
jgi:leader peptidase (prepilin peptidase)/N-methyltransferase